MAQRRMAARGLATLLGVPLTIAAVATTALAQDLMSLEPGTEIEKIASIGGKQLPLPDGKWEFVMSEADRRGSAKAGSAFLVRKANGRIAAYIFVRATLEIEVDNGWKRPGWCDRSNVHHNGSDNYYNKNDALCWMLVQQVFTNKVHRVELFNRIGDYRRKHDATSTLVGNRYWRNDSHDYLLVAHFVDPAAYGFPAERGKRWRESKWHVNSVGDGTPRRRFVDALKAFGEKYREAVRKGFSNRLGTGGTGLKFAFEQ